MTRDQILREIRRTAAENGGVPLGRELFQRQTGIREADWSGKYWARWGDAVSEAGFPPNALKGRLSDDYLLRHYALLTRELGRVPTGPELRLKRRSDPNFPNDKVYSRLGTKRELLNRLRVFCEGDTAFADVCGLLGEAKDNVTAEIDTAMVGRQPLGTVYLLRSGRYFKIGRTKAMGRREYELAIQLPEKARLVHEISTDDPEGIEAYWHRRFASKRANGEWFALSAEDVSVFRRRKFQ